MLADPDDDALRMAEEFTDMLPNGHEKSIAATMRHSLKQLGEEGLDFLRLAAQLSPAPIPSSLVASTFAVVDGLEEPKAKLRAAQAFNQTEKHSLAQVVEPKQGLRSVHALVSRVIRFDDDHVMRCQVLRAAAVQALHNELQIVVDIRTHQNLEHQVSHAREMVKQLESENDATLGGWIAWHDHELGNYSSARKVLESVLTVQLELLGEEHPNTLISMNNLAESLREQGDLTGARTLQEKVLEISRRVLGEDHPDTLHTMNNLGGTLQAQGDLLGARTLQEQVLEILRRVLGEEHPSTLFSFNNLAGTLQKQGDLAGARTLQEKALEISRRVLGEEHPETLPSMNNLAITLREQGDLIGSRTLQEKVLEISLRILGEEHPKTLTIMSNLATTLKSLGDISLARTLQERALEFFRRVFGKDHPKTSISAFNLYWTLLQSHAHKEANHIFQSDLGWLLKSNPATLGADQQGIRAQLIKIVESKTPRTSQPSRRKQGKRKKK